MDSEVQSVHEGAVHGELQWPSGPGKGYGTNKKGLGLGTAGRALNGENGLLDPITYRSK